MGQKGWNQNLTEYKLPIEDGDNGQLLVTDGNGNVDWQSVAGATPQIKVNTATVSNPDFTNDEVEHSVTGSTIKSKLATTIKTDIAKGVTANDWGNHADAGYQATSAKGQANGYAGLNANSKVPLVNLEQQGAIEFKSPLFDEVLATGEFGVRQYAVKSGTITKARMWVTDSSTITVDVYVNGSKISASAPLTITAGTFLDETTFTGWTKTIVAGDYITINILSNNNAKDFNLQLITE